MATYPEIGSSAAPADTRTGTDPQSRSASEGMHTGSSGAASGASDARHMTEEARQKVTEQARGMADQVREQARTQLAGQKEKAAQQLGSIEEALRQTSHTLREQEQSPVADYVERAAQQVGQLNHYLRHHTVSDLMDEAERYARREPALFLGGAALLGLAAARFFRASTPHTGSNRHAAGSGGYRPVHNTAGAEMPRTNQQTTEFVASTSDMPPMEGRYNG